MTHNVVIICYRMEASRLPGKPLAVIEGETLLQHVVERYGTSSRVDSVLVAIPSGEADDGLARLCKHLGVPCHRGSNEDVVSRMNGAILKYAPEATAVFRGLGDMPLVDIPLLDWRFDLLARHGADVLWCGQADDLWPVYGSRESPWSRKAWDGIFKNSIGLEREHVGQWLYSNLARFAVVHTEMLSDEYYRPYRLELDSAADLAFFRAIFDALYKGPGTPTTLEALRWLDEHPEVAALNSSIPTKTLTQVEWEKRRGSMWRCDECGSFPLHADVVKTVHRGDKTFRRLETKCPRCNKVRKFYESAPQEDQWLEIP